MIKKNTNFLKKMCALTSMITMKTDMGRSGAWEGRQQARSLFENVHGGQNTGLVFRTISSLSPKAPKPPSPCRGGAMNSMHLSSLFKIYFKEFLFPLRHGGLL